jgi:hypothetical protein
MQKRDELVTKNNMLDTEIRIKENQIQEKSNSLAIIEE